MHVLAGTHLVKWFRSNPFYTTVLQDRVWNMFWVSTMWTPHESFLIKMDTLLEMQLSVFADAKILSFLGKYFCVQRMGARISIALRSATKGSRDTHQYYPTHFGKDKETKRQRDKEKKDKDTKRQTWTNKRQKEKKTKREKRHLNRRHWSWVRTKNKNSTNYTLVKHYSD